MIISQEVGSLIKEEIVGIVYCLIDPETHQIRYVGQTIGPVNRRLSKHISDSRYTNTHVRCWIKGLIDKGEKPGIKIIAEANSISNLDDLEIFYIEKLKKDGCDLTNMSIGGNVRRIHSSEMRNKIANTLKGRTHSEETKEKRRESCKKAWECPSLREIKREQSIRLNSLGLIGSKGMPSKKKGLPFAGDKQKISDSLKEYYLSNTPHNKIISIVRDKIAVDYLDNSVTLDGLAKKYGVNRMSITKIAKEKGLSLRNGGKKNIGEITLRTLSELGKSVKEIAAIHGCSVAQVEKLKRKFKIYANIRRGNFTD